MESNNKFPKKGEIWLVDYSYKFKSDNNSYEIESKIKKLRPSVILSNDIQNQYSDDILVAPLTSIELNNIEETEVFIKSSKESGLDKNSKVLLYIIRTIDKNNRIKEFIGKVSYFELENIEKGIKIIFDINL